MTDSPFLPVDPSRPVPLVVVVSGPSGVGKTELCRRVLEADPSLVRSISATTRPMRPGETDGVDYDFWDGARFRDGIRREHFLEWAEVHDHLYGTPRARIEEQVARGRSPVLNVDVQGGRSVKALRDDAVLIFLVPPSWQVLEERLRRRGTDSEKVIAVRLANARGELAQWIHYDYLVVNDDLDDAVARVGGILAAERARIPRLRASRG